MSHPWFEEIPVHPAPEKIEHTNTILSMGSCFAQEVGDRLETRKFRVLNNPAGTLFNPVSMETVWLYASGQLEWDADQAYENQGVWYSWDHHGAVFGHSRDALETRVLACHNGIKKVLTDDCWILITLGSAWVYEHKESEQIVANCHKAPAQLFEKKLLSVERCQQALQNMVAIIRSMAPGCRIVLTLSPVRHKRDGYHENQLSKSTLLLAMESVLKEWDRLYYFPSYEIALDELRDYRFFTEDRCHLTREATDYIFQVFEKAFMDDNTMAINEACTRIARDLGHRPLHGNHYPYHRHLEGIRQRMLDLKTKYPFLNFDQETDFLKCHLPNWK
jgi:hypothetical protein